MELGNDTQWPRPRVKTISSSAVIAAALFASSSAIALCAVTKLKDADLASSVFGPAQRFQREDLEETTLGMPGHLASSQANPRPALASLARSKSTYAARGGYSYALPVASAYPMQFPFREGPGVTGTISGPFLRGDVRAAANKVLEKEFGQPVDEDIEKRIEEGTMNFEDFLQATEMIDKMRGLAGVMKFVPGMKKAMPSQKQIDAAAQQARVFKRIVNGMTQEEKMNPGLFFDESAPGRIEKVSQECAEQPETVERFLQQFKLMRSMMSRMAKGEDAEDIEKDLMDDGSIPEGNRKARRQRAKAEKKQAGQTASVSGGGFR